MTINQALEYRNNQNSRIFKVSKNWVMVKGKMDTKFKDHSSIEKFIESVEEEINNKNARENCNKVVDFLKGKKIELLKTSTFGSFYFYTKNGLIRVSNHHYTSDLHKETSLNLCSYEENGFNSLIEQVENFLNK
jgi:hypothetical protein